MRFSNSDYRDNLYINYVTVLLTTNQCPPHRINDLKYREMDKTYPTERNEYTTFILIILITCSEENIKDTLS